MITPTKKANRISKDFVVCDIENRIDGSVITIDTFDGNAHQIHYDWGTWLAWVGDRAKTDRSFRTIYAHNGGGWDWLSFLEWCIAHNPNQEFTTIENGNRIIAITIPVSDRLTIRLTDSLYLLHCSLEQASQKYLGIGKVEIGDKLPEWYWENDRETYWRYAFRDCENLFKILVSFSDLVYAKIAPVGRLGLTLPATAMRAFTTGFLNREVVVPTNEKVKALLREGYTGGRVEVFKSGYFPRVKVYDFNSLYPSVMANTPVPVTGNVQWTRKLDCSRTGVFRVRFVQRDRTKLPLLLVGGVGVYAGEGVYFTPELRRLAGLAGSQIDVIEGFNFCVEETLFRSFVETLYALRMTDREGSLGNTCKLLMNSLYGKFAQRPERTRTCHMGIEAVTKLIQTGVSVETISEQNGIYRIAESRSVNFEHVGIAGTITSEARARLWESCDYDTVYVDTDSVHSIGANQPANVDRMAIGAFKLEYEGEGVYVGKKLYALRNSQAPNPKDREKVRAKGIRVGGRNGFDLGFDSLVSLLDSSHCIPCTFTSGTTANAVLKGKTACVFNPRTRRIRKTANV